MIVATAPSMDGYASATSSMTRNGLKVSIPSKSASVIIGDVDILKNAPMEMLISGLGDMLAKYISIAEWRISHIVTGEYYCETVANVIRYSLAACVENADGLLRRDGAAVEAVFKGLVTAGAAMSYAGTSRPASGVEHYFSHLWDMRGVEFGEKISTHGIQCAVGTLIAARLYERMRRITPNREKGLAYARAFDKDAWFTQLTAFLGKGAQDMIALDAKEQKYAVDKHAARLEIIMDQWDTLTAIMREEIPSAAFIEALLDRIGCPKSVSAWGLSEDILPMTFMATKDIRDKYVLSRLAFDLGVLDEMAAVCGSEEL
jgi:glycerol-1-phosphate dehydrogenase [NAD(P)+]